MCSAPFQKNLSIYVHWPFCRSKCPYCDFNVHVRSGIDAEAWRTGLLRALDFAFQQTGARTLKSLYFGGGTPSLMPAQTVAAIVSHAQSLWHGPELEVTLEANPSDVKPEILEAFSSAGVNRISLGVQSFNDESLALLGRNHSALEAREAVKLISEQFSRWSLDLMTALPGQSEDARRDDISEALSFSPRHVSVYQLTIEPGTVFEAQVRAGDLYPTDNEDAARIYEQTGSDLDVAGLPAYEISNYARSPTDWSLHNLSGWRYQDYVGIGPGAHGRITYDGNIHATRQHRAPEIWLERLLKSGNTKGSAELYDFQTCSVLSPEEAASEWLMAGLRTAAGVDLSVGAKRLGIDPQVIIQQGQVKTLVEGGWIRADDNRLAVTLQGRLVLNEILRRLLVVNDTD